MSASVLTKKSSGANTVSSTSTGRGHRRVRSDEIRRASVANLKALNIEDMVNVVRADHTEIEVDREQLERVKMMHKKFRDGSKFSFNYNTLLLVASVLAGIGLISNSSATIIASMLVSPIMVGKSSG